MIPNFQKVAVTNLFHHEVVGWNNIISFLVILVVLITQAQFTGTLYRSHFTVYQNLSQYMGVKSWNVSLTGQRERAEQSGPPEI